MPNAFFDEHVTWRDARRFALRRGVCFLRKPGAKRAFGEQSAFCDGRSPKAMAVVAKSCLACDSFACNGPFFNTAPSLRRRSSELCIAAEYHGPQHSVRLPCFLRGVRSMFCADAIGFVAGAAFSKTRSVNFMAGAAFHSFASVARRK